ncbi:MAG: adenosylcobalamin-dependent ribonucleoside-diphosphate reductase [Thermoplasmata archaeon]
MLRNKENPKFIRKRNGELEPWTPNKIIEAMRKAFVASGVKVNSEELERLEKEVETRLPRGTPSVEQVQKRVLEVLAKYPDVYLHYKTYMEARAVARKVKKEKGISTDVKFSPLALEVLGDRYLLKDKTGNIIETPEGMFMRVARWVALPDLVYNNSIYDPSGSQKPRKLSLVPSAPDYLTGAEWGKLKLLFLEKAMNKQMKVSFFDFVNYLKSSDVKEYYIQQVKNFYNAMVSLKFLPNSPTLMNAGTDIGQLSACFVIPVDDSIDGIYDALKIAAKVHKSGGGTGFSFSRLRPEGDIVGSTNGVASGPVSFMKIFDVSTETIKQGGKRRGANMGILRIDHPDIRKFILSKDQKNKVLTNFNISVAVTDKFMNALRSDSNFPLRNPRTGETVEYVSAKDLWSLIINHAWMTGDPGVIYIDEINRHNPTPLLGMIESTNPCGEQPLLPFESCNLGSIDLKKFVKNGAIDWADLREVLHLAIHFLDNVIDVNQFPLKEIEHMTKKTRKIGLGVMGFAEMLIKLGIPYDSDDAELIASKVMKFINDETHIASSRLASRGVFPAWKGSVWDGRGILMRNATTTTIAPTGTISIIADTSSSIEPLFALAYYRNYKGRKHLILPDSVKDYLIRRGVYSDTLVNAIAKAGTILGEDVPDDVKNVLKIALEIPPERHVRMQALFQRYTDNAVSKTINMPSTAAIEDVGKAYLLAYDLGCKGVTVYRDKSKSEQVLELVAPVKEAKEEKSKPLPELTFVVQKKIEGVEVSGTFDNACPTGKCDGG